MRSRRVYELLCAATICVTSGSGCSHTKTAKTAPAAALPTPTQQANLASLDKAPVQASANVAVSGDLAAQCKLRFESTEQSPKFAYNADDLLASDRDVLQQVAECLLRGPLQGHNVELIGHTDPRGTDEYNLGLGDRRAHTVQSYLEHLGVPATRLAPTTRGEVDAAGTDEPGWQRDRRVDLQLVK